MPDTLIKKYIDAWETIDNPALDAENPHFKNKYATLKGTMKIIRDVCKPRGIAYFQVMTRCENGVEITTKVVDETNSLALSQLFVEQPMNPQAFGSNLTYAKRQLAQLDWGIVGEEDDDANAAVDGIESETLKRSVDSASKKKSDNKRDAYIKRIGELREQASSLGITETGIDSYIHATFAGKKVEELNLRELEKLGKHISTLIVDKQRLDKETVDVDQ